MNINEIEKYAKIRKTDFSDNNRQAEIELRNYELPFPLIAHFDEIEGLTALSLQLSEISAPSCVATYLLLLRLI